MQLIEGVAGLLDGVADAGQGQRGEEPKPARVPGSMLGGELVDLPRQAALLASPRQV